MEIYRYYYGAAAGKGIGVRAQSKALENLPLSSFLKELSSLHALESAEHKGEKLCYLLEKDGYSILGLSYLESPKESGYNRTAPCGLQYIIPTVAMRALGHYYGEIVQKVEFRKPESYEPEPIQRFPKYKNFPESGCPQEVLIQIVDSLVKVTLSKDGILLIALPKDLKSEYETARAAIGEALDYLPDSLRKNVRFLTGLPVPEGETKCLTGYENAIRLNANVVFCPNQYYKELKVYRSFIGVDMANPTSEVGTFASYIVQSSDLENDLSRINDRLLKAPGKQPYEELNQVTEELIEEAEVQRRKLAQALANGKKKSGKRKDNGSSIPNVQTDRRRMDKTTQDIDIPISGSGRNKGNSNYDSNTSRSLQQTSHGNNYQGADSGCPYPRDNKNGSPLKNDISRNQSVPTSGNNNFHSKKSEEEEEEKNSVGLKIITVFAIIAALAVLALVLWFTVFNNNAPNPTMPQPSTSTTFIESPNVDEYLDMDAAQENTESTAIPVVTAQMIINEKDSTATNQPNDELVTNEDVEETNISNENITSQSEATSNEVLYNRNVKITGVRVALRQTPSDENDNNIIKRLEKGTSVFAIRKENDVWTEVSFNEEKGYMMTKFLEISSQ